MSGGSGSITAAGADCLVPARSGRSPCSRSFLHSRHSLGHLSNVESSAASPVNLPLPLALDSRERGLAKSLADHPTDVSKNARRPRGRGQTALSVDTDQHRPVRLGPRHGDVAERVLTVASSFVGNPPILGKT